MNIACFLFRKSGRNKKLRILRMTFSSKPSFYAKHFLLLFRSLMGVFTACFILFSSPPSLHASTFPSPFFHDSFCYSKNVKTSRSCDRIWCPSCSRKIEQNRTKRIGCICILSFLTVILFRIDCSTRADARGRCCEADRG